MKVNCFCPIAVMVVGRMVWRAGAGAQCHPGGERHADARKVGGIRSYDDSGNAGRWEQRMPCCLIGLRTKELDNKEAGFDLV